MFLMDWYEHKNSTFRCLNLWMPKFVQNLKLTNLCTVQIKIEWTEFLKYKYLLCFFVNPVINSKATAIIKANKVRHDIKQWRKYDSSWKVPNSLWVRVQDMDQILQKWRLVSSTTDKKWSSPLNYAKSQW